MKFISLMPKRKADPSLDPDFQELLGTLTCHFDEKFHDGSAVHGKELEELSKRNLYWRR